MDDTHTLAGDSCVSEKCTWHYSILGMAAKIKKFAIKDGVHSKSDHICNQLKCISGLMPLTIRSYAQIAVTTHGRQIHN